MTALRSAGLRSGFRSVVDEQRSLWCVLDLNQLEPLELVSGVGIEEPLAVTGDVRWNDDPKVIDESCPDQLAGELGTGVDPDVATGLLLEVSYVVQWRSAHHGAVVPRFAEV